jgi:hypothetical protein
MKKQLFFPVIAILFLVFQAKAQSVSVEEARLAALHFFNSRAKSQISAMRQIIHSAKSAQANHSDAYYVFEPSEGNGFVIISADKNATPILGYATENKFQFEAMPPQIQSWMDRYENQIKEIQLKKYQGTVETKLAWSALEKNAKTATAEQEKIVWPLLKTSWDQIDPYNYWTPVNSAHQHAVTGCVATAMAQIMRYWEWPSGNLGSYYEEYDDDKSDIKGTFFAEIGGGQYDWKNMPNTPTPGDPSSLNLALLIFHAGVSVHMNYGLSLSTANSGDVADALNDYFYFEEGDHRFRDDYDENEWYNMLQTSINSGIPVYYSNPEHAWVCDGYDDHWFHMNWGWGGANNGFYNLTDLTPGTHNFNLLQDAVFGIVPQGLNCPKTFFSSDVVNSSITTQRWISAQSTVYAPTVATFSAKDSITLRPGFNAYAGCTFTAKIGGCSGNFQGGNAGEERSVASNRHPKTNAALENSALNIAPNPFSGTTTITYTLPDEQPVSLQLMDATGSIVATPVTAQIQSEGEHQFNLEAGNLPPGLYFLSAQLGEKRVSKRLLLVK